MIDYMELGQGKFKIIEKDITEKRVKELEEEVRIFNKNPINGIYRGIFSDFQTEKK